MNKCLFLIAIVGTFYVADALFKLTKGKKGKLDLGSGAAAKPDKDDDGWEYHSENPESCGKLDISAADLQKLQTEDMVDLKDMPWVVYLVQKLDTGVVVPVCLATLLPDVDDESTSILLTNSLCYRESLSLSRYSIYAGRQLPIPAGAELIPIESVVLDRESVKATFDNAMVITIQGEIELDADHKVMCLPEPLAVPKIGSPCVLSTQVPYKDGTVKPTLYKARYEDGEVCNGKASLGNNLNTKLEFCGWDKRDGSMLGKGGPMMCLEGDRWVQYGVIGYARHVIEQDSIDYNQLVHSDKEKPTAVVSVGRFRKLMADSKSLQKFGRINLMSSR